MTEVVPEEIIHLDFDPVAVVEAEPEKAKKCDHFFKHPLVSGAKIYCHRPAEVTITLGNKPCGHTYQRHFCRACWDHVNADRELIWFCARCWRENGVRTNYKVHDAITAWSMI